MSQHFNTSCMPAILVGIREDEGSWQVQACFGNCSSTGQHVQEACMGHECRHDRALMRHSCLPAADPMPCEHACVLISKSQPCAAQMLQERKCKRGDCSLTHGYSTKDPAAECIS